VTHRRLLLLSNSTNRGERYLAHARPHLLRFLGGAGRLLFVPYAAVRMSHDAYAEAVEDALAADGHTVVRLHREPDPRGAIASADAIVVGGGNTFRLLQLLQQHALLDPIRARVAAGAPYVGWSAGSNVACPTIRTTNDMPIVAPAGLDSLGLVRFQINPHYTDARIPRHGGESRGERLAEFCALSPEVPVIGLREGSALEVRGGAVTLIGRRRARLFHGGAPPRELAPGPVALEA
jgi:dipeptidase E